MVNFMPSKLEAHHDYVVYNHVKMPMRDGIELEAKIYFPSKNGVVDFDKKYPTALARVAYLDMMGGTAPNLLGYFCCERGYAVMVQAVRGTSQSGGELQPIANEGWGAETEEGYGGHVDGVDTIAWIRKQPWSDGRVVTSGISYMGATQYLLQLSGDIEGLITSVINCPGVNNFGGGMVYAQEFADPATMIFWPILSSLMPGYFKRQPKEVQEAILRDAEKIGNPHKHPELMGSPDYYRKLTKEYSLREMPVARLAPYYQKWLDHRDNPDFFAYADTSTRRHDMKAPILFQSSWCDLFEMNAINAYVQAVKDAPSEEIAKAHRLIVGTWPHEYNPTLPLRQFPETDTDQRLFVMEWFEQQLNGVESAFFRENPVTIFVMGENRWRSEKSWPLSDEVRIRFFLHSDGKANTRLGSGILSENEPVTDEAQDHYHYDPSDPVVSYGGNSMLGGGMSDQRTVEMRQDVLVYTSAPLEEDLEVTGVINGTVYAATSAEDTDFIMKLLDVTLDGNVYNIAQGGRRGRYITNGRKNPTPLQPGEIHAYEMNMRATSYVFKKGHRIRVEVTSSDSLLCDVNPNAFVDLNTCTKADYVVADQTIYHDRERASFIELPVIPASHERRWVEWPYHASVTGVDTMVTKKIGNPPVVAEYLGDDLPVNKD